MSIVGAHDDVGEGGEREPPASDAIAGAGAEIASGDDGEEHKGDGGDAAIESLLELSGKSG